jgi:sporulation protein YlmC with PRC-barrel domain
MKRIALHALAGVAIVMSGAAHAQVAGGVRIGVVQTEVALLAKGWSVKRSVLGQPVYNDSNEKIGNVDDLIISPEKAVSYAIVGVGGFLGIGRHDVVIPVDQFKLINDKLVLTGATKEALKALPPFVYAK